jgi:hypothetical protein
VIALVFFSVIVVKDAFAWVGGKDRASSKKVVVSNPLFGRRAITIRNARYYYNHSGVYYRRSPLGYIVISDPNYYSGMGRVVINIFDLQRGIFAITLNRFRNGYLGPMGEYYSVLPTTVQLRLRYIDK